MRVLIVEDEKKMAGFIARGLKEEGYAVDIAYDGETGWEYAATNDYDVIILDWMLPKMSGLEVCTRLRKGRFLAPILMLTARDQVEDKIEGLNQGADDYLAKPFSFDELLARLRALLRRPRELAKEKILKAGDLKIDLLARSAMAGHEEIYLSQKEFSLLEYLIRHKGEAVSRIQIAEHVWDIHFDPMTNTIDVYINFLRKKIDGSRSKSRIETVRGQGYRLMES